LPELAYPDIAAASKVVVRGLWFSERLRIGRFTAYSFVSAAAPVV